LENEAFATDLKQRNIMMDGVNGYDFVQTKAEGIPVLVNPESMIKTDTMEGVGMGEMQIGLEDVNLVGTVLQVNGVPVLVNPESMIKTDTMTGVGMGQMQIGLEDVELMQKKGEDDFTRTPTITDSCASPVEIEHPPFPCHAQKEKKPASDEMVVLQVNGVPVLVNPESMIKTDTMTGVGLGEMQIGLEDVNLVDQGTVLQVKGVPVFVAPESMLRTDTYTGGVGLGEMEVGIDELKNLNIGLSSEVVLQVNGVPVYVTPESMLRTDTITSVGVGKMDVGIDELKNLNVAIDSEIVMQVHGKPVGIKMMADNTLLMNPVENPPYNNWSTN
jgi:hypothetical protein